MSDGDAKAKARFEPPPWEQEAFEALAARRAGERAAREALDAAAARAAAAPGGTVQEPDPWDEVPDEPVIVPGGGIVEPDPDPVVAGRPAAVDERAVEAMLIQLQSEERAGAHVAKKIGLIASALTCALGLGMLIAGLVMMRVGAGKQAAMIGSLVLSVFGLCFMGMAAWVWISTTRSKGRR